MDDTEDDKSSGSGATAMTAKIIVTARVGKRLRRRVCCSWLEAQLRASLLAEEYGDRAEIKIQRERN
jgi:hypothetical protein